MLVLIATSVGIVSCGSSSSANKHTVSGLPFRAFVSNPLFNNGTNSMPVINIVDALHDVLSTSNISLLTTEAQPGLMVVSPDLHLTIVYSPAGNSVVVIDNSLEATATQTGSTTNLVPTITLPGLTESMLIGKDNLTAFAAVPTAPVTGQSPGGVVVMNVGTGAITATIPVAGAHFIALSPDGNNLLVFSDRSNTVTVINVPLVATNEDPRSYITGFDHPVWGIFSDDADAYIFNCGPQCGGTTAGIATLNLSSPTAGSGVALSAATFGMLSGTTLYVAGTPPKTPCDSGSGATYCGTLNLVNVGSMSVINSSPILITDGYHDRMQISQNGQLFIGAHSCTSVTGVRGCLSIFDTTSSTVVIPPQAGDATGIQPISGRNIVYVCEGGVFEIFDTTTDELLVQTTPTNIVGQVYDVKLVDPPTN